VQILHPVGGSLQEYLKALQAKENAHRWNPSHCPLCRGKDPLVTHGFYQRTVVDQGFDGVIRIYRYLCRLCRRTVSLLPEFLLPYLRFSIPLVGRFLKARMLEGRTLKDSAASAGLAGMPYQRGQHWIRRFLKQAASVAAALVALTAAVPAPSLVSRALGMLQTVGWVPAHRFLFSELRQHLLGWPAFLAPDGQCLRLRPLARPPGA
jgi:transposase-like protein